MTLPERGGRRWLQLALGIAISVVMMWWAFRGEDLTQVWQHVRTMRPMPMAAAVLLATLPFLLRIPRWQHLLYRDDGSRIGAQPMWHAVAIGFAANNTLPFRVGEVLRMGAISKLAHVSFASALSSLVVERVLDALTVVFLLSIALLIVDLPAGVEVVGIPIQEAATRMGILGAVALLLTIIVALTPQFSLRIVTAITPAGRLRDMALGITNRLLDGIAALRDPRRAVPVIGWSLVIWLVNASAFWVGFRAFGIEAPFAAALILQGVLVFVIAPPQAPGFVGVFEAAIKGTLVLFAVNETVALAYAVTYHVTTFVPITLLGAWSLVSTGLSLRSAREAAA